MNERKSRLGILMSGGGARAAYQVGLLRFVAKKNPDLQTPILTGVSAGAINAAHLASREGTFAEAVDGLTRLWCSITPDHIYRTDSFHLWCNFFRWALRFISGGSRAAPPTRGLMDTEPLRELLHASLPTTKGELIGVTRNIERGRLDAVGITTSNYGTGQSVTWVQGNSKETWTRPHRRSVEIRLTVEHIMASAALPMLFPAIELAGGWHGDGGIRLTAPLSPAMHLGADRILAISTRKARNPEDVTSTIHGYPPPAQVIGNLTNAIFLDMLDFDALNLTRINQLIRAVPEDRRNGLRPVDVLVLRPSEDLGRLASRFERRLPRSVRFFTRGFGTQETDAPDSLALLMFQQDYLDYLIHLGEADAEKRAEEISEFLDF